MRELKFGSSHRKDVCRKPLADFLAHYLRTLLPYFEGLLGIHLPLGLPSRVALTAEGLPVTVPLFGTALRLAWTVVSQQMISILFVFLLLATEEHDCFSVDGFPARRRSQ